MAGVALAAGLERAVLAWAGPPGNLGPRPAKGPDMRPLPWQAAAWRPVVARTAAGAAIVAVLLAGVRFEGFEAIRVGVIGIALLACAATDLLAYRVPDAVTVPALALALVLSAAAGGPELASALMAAAMAGGLLLLAAVLTRGGLGGGDVKLGALIGAALGLPMAAFALAAGIVIGGFVVIGLYAMRWLEKDQAFPFAPFLALAALAFLLAG